MAEKSSLLDLGSFSVPLPGKKYEYSLGLSLSGKQGRLPMRDAVRALLVLGSLVLLAAMPAQASAQSEEEVRAVMELVNDAYKLKDGLFGDPQGDAALRFATATAASLIFPFAPHLGAEIWELLEGGRVWEEPWPEADPAMLSKDTFTLVVQVNGKVRAKIEAESRLAEVRR